MPNLQGEVIRVRAGFHISWKGVVSSTTWADKGPAEAQLDLLRSGYSAMTMDGRIKHVRATTRTRKAVRRGKA